MSTKTLTNDLDNCLINFDHKILITNLLDDYGGLLEETAKTVQQFLAAEEKKGKEFEKIYLLRGTQLDSNDEVITLVNNDKLNERKEKLRNAQSLLYSAEIKGGTKSPPTEFVPLRQMAIKLDSLVVKDIPVMVNPGLLPTSSNGTSSVKESVANTKKPGGALGAMFKKQETKEAAASAAPKSAPDTSTPKRPEPEKKTDKSGPLGAMFKKQEAAASKKSPKAEPEKKTNSLGAMFKKQEAAAAKKSPTKSNDKPDSKSSRTKLSSFLTKKDEDKPKSSPPKKKETPKIKEEPTPSNISVNLFEESESSDDEEALDALKRQVLTDEDENDDDKPATSNKRRRIVDSDEDEEDTGPEVKIERKEETEEKVEEMEVEETEEPTKSETFLDDDGFVVTKKAKRQSLPKKKPNPTPVKIKTPSKVKKESPPSSKKKETTSKTTTGPKTKQGNIMNFFTKK
ncbi:DNA polymerase delta subunit 3 [Episyrphus balteatus]|uniref:DNA polymerase delta subunit 3 n=1 Tax=Episyrphus balteatus TaxID=286459 RepID=UPI002485F52D|nr:DNA polymerase delta subunit 3 [Episyrphus balteatus]